MKELGVDFLFIDILECLDGECIVLLVLCVGLGVEMVVVIM